MQNVSTSSTTNACACASFSIHFSVPPSDLLLRLGEYDLAEEEEPYLYQERRVQIVASHPQFDPRTFEYDLALLRFYEPVVFQPNIIPVCVPDSDENFIGRTAFVTGWGRLYEGKSFRFCFFCIQVRHRRKRFSHIFNFIRPLQRARYRAYCKKCPCL